MPTCRVGTVTPVVNIHVGIKFLRVVIIHTQSIKIYLNKEKYS